jgi:hypothetical protein
MTLQLSCYYPYIVQLYEFLHCDTDDVDNDDGDNNGVDIVVDDDIDFVVVGDDDDGDVDDNASFDDGDDGIDYVVVGDDDDGDVDDNASFDDGDDGIDYVVVGDDGDGDDDIDFVVLEDVDNDFDDGDDDIDFVVLEDDGDDDGDKDDDDDNVAGIMRTEDLWHVFKASPQLGGGEEAAGLGLSLLHKFELALSWDARLLLVPPLLPVRPPPAPQVRRPAQQYHMPPCNNYKSTISLLMSPLMGHKPSSWITHKENGL